MFGQGFTGIVYIGVVFGQGFTGIVYRGGVWSGAYRDSIEGWCLVRGLQDCARFLKNCVPHMQTYAYAAPLHLVLSWSLSLDLSSPHTLVCTQTPTCGNTKEGVKKFFISEEESLIWASGVLMVVVAVVVTVEVWGLSSL